MVNHPAKFLAIWSMLEKDTGHDVILVRLINHQENLCQAITNTHTLSPLLDFCV